MKIAVYSLEIYSLKEFNKKPENIDNIKKFNYELGKHSDKILNSDFIIKSPGIPNSVSIIKKCQSKKIPILSEIEFSSLFTSSPILALTGSNGKTTTINLLYQMCISDGKNALIGGNIGIPFSENVLLEITSKMDDVVHVLEISSFQLDHINSFCPKIASIINVSEDHMDRYIDFDDYVKTKIKITKNITTSGKIIYNKDDSHLNNFFHNNNLAIPFSINNNVKTDFILESNKIFINSNGEKKLLLNLNETKLKGNHNIQNILAASTIAYYYGISNKAIKESIRNFKPIPHRLEWVGKINKIHYINYYKWFIYSTSETK